jgi:hypothetical protein
VESSEKPVDDKVLHAMAQAYPDPVDLTLLSMVLASDVTCLEKAASDLVAAGLARGRTVVEAGAMRLEAPCITDKGMAVADGLAGDAAEAGALLDRLEAEALRQLLVQRIRGSRLGTQKTDELRGSLAAVSDRALVDAGKVWAHQTVSDWRPFMRAMQGATTASAQAVAGGTATA